MAWRKDGYPKIGSHLPPVPQGENAPADGFWRPWARYGGFMTVEQEWWATIRGDALTEYMDARAMGAEDVFCHVSRGPFGDLSPVAVLRWRAATREEALRPIYEVLDVERCEWNRAPEPNLSDDQAIPPAQVRNSA